MSDPGSIDAHSRRRGRLPPHVVWPGIIIALIGLSLTVCVVTVVLATNDESFGVEPSYYNKALAWDETLRQRQESERLGWSIEPAIGVDESGRQRLVATIRDAAGRPVMGAEATAIAFHRARIKDQQDLAFTDLGDGRYAALITIDRAGLWEFRFTIKRGEDTFTAAIEHLIVG